jgi:putative hydroxymethylpyrimidine transport system permease protein
MKFLRPLITLAGLALLWWAITALTAAPAYMLPTPWHVAQALVLQRGILAPAALTTLTEILAGLAIGCLLGAASGLVVVYSPLMRRWLMPLLLLSQAVPVFALAPLLVLWFGFGMASKIVMTVLIIFFPVTAALADGMRRADRGWLDLAATMNASPAAMLRHVRLPAAMPSFCAGLRIATATAPIGAIIGEWVGASSGLGYVMMNASARMETDVMFAALAVLGAITVGLWAAMDALIRHILYWAPEN